MIFTLHKLYFCALIEVEKGVKVNKKTEPGRLEFAELCLERLLGGSLGLLAF